MKQTDWLQKDIFKIASIDKIQLRNDLIWILN